MDGVSAAASVLTIVQLAAKVKSIYDFWVSVKGAPDDFRNIAADLSILSTVLADIASEAQHQPPDASMSAVLQNCCEKVTVLSSLIDGFEPGFASTNVTVRKWSAVRAVFKGDKLAKIQRELESMKGTLLLVQARYQR